jgi:hypothetical protein
LRTVYRAGRQLAKVRAVTLFSVAFAFGFLYWGYDLLTTFGLRPADGGVLAPLGERLAWAAFLWACGLGFPIGMWIYGRCYVAEIVVDEPNKRLVVKTLRFLGTSDESLPFGVRTTSNYHHGQYYAGGVRVKAPWTTVQVTGRRLPLILDQQGEFADRDILERRLLGRPG